MSKKIDWEKTFKAPFRRNLSGQSGVKGKYASGRDLLQKTFKEMKTQEELRKNFNKLLPAMQQLMMIRMKSGTPLTVVRPLRYTTHELKKAEQPDGQIIPLGYVDIIKTIKPGTKLLLKSLNPSLQQFVFEDSSGELIEMSYSEKTNLFTQTDIWEVVNDVMNESSDE